MTREVHELVRIDILGPDGELETVEGTTIHPIWSEDRQDWVPLGELQPGETLRAATGDAIVLTVQILNQAIPVYNIEVHGEHVYQVGQLGLLIHNAGDCLVRFGQKAETTSELAADAARALANGFPNGVSTKLVSRITGSDKLHKFASLEDVMEVFEVAQTGSRKNHFTVFLPNPVTDDVTILFNRLFKPKS